MIREIKLLLVFVTVLFTGEAAGQITGEAREYSDPCVHLNDSSSYSFRMEVVNDSLKYQILFEMLQTFTVGEESHNVQVDIDSFQSKSKIYRNELIKSFLLM